MKRRLLIILIAAIALSACSHDPAVHAAFHKYSGEEGVTSITVPGFAIKAIASLAEMKPEEKALLRKIDLVKILTIEDEQHFKQVNFCKEFGKYVSGSFQPLLSVKDGQSDVQIMAVMENEEEISELLILVGGPDNALIYLRGDFNLSQIAQETNLLKGKGWKEMISIAN